MTNDIVRDYVTVTSGRVSYLRRERGAEGPTLVLIHGSGMSARYWIEQLRYLEVGARIVALDLPGHGGSHDRCAASIEDYAAVTADVIDGLGAAPAIVVGHSLGGAIGVAVAARRPADVRGLVLLSTCARLPVSREPAHPLLPLLPAVIRKLMFFATAKNLLFAPTASRRAIGLGMQELRGCRAATIEHDVGIARTMDVRALAQTLRVPTLIICGARDRLTPPALSEELHRLIAGSRLVLVERAGHMVLVEAPAIVNDHVERFVTGLVGGPRGPRRLPKDVGIRRRLTALLARWAHSHC